MSRFDDEIIKQAENAYQERGLSGQTTTPRQQPYDQVNTVGTDSAPGVFQAPAPAEEMKDWVANTPAVRTIEVRDLESADPSKPGVQGEIIGGPGSSAVYPEGQQMYASVNPIDESLYNVYKASRQIRDAISEEVDFDFGNLFTAANDASTVMRFASVDADINQVVGTIASIVSDIENDLATTGDYRQASADLTQLEGLLEDINKFASKEEDDEDEEEECKDCKGKGCDKCKKKSKKKASVVTAGCKGEGCDIPACDGVKDGATMTASVVTAACTGAGCKKDECEGTLKSGHNVKCSGDKCHKSCKKTKTATNGNQETLQVVDVRDLDDQAGVWDRQRVTTPDHVTNVLVPEDVNGEDAGYVPFYNDGAETGIEPGNGPHHQQIDFQDGTNPALAPYAGTVAAVQASREKIFEAMQIVERLEKLGMVQHDDRAKHIAKFEQMSNASLVGFKTALDTFEDSGARQPRSQKVASGSNRLPEMGRLTTASTVKRQDVASDDWLMTL
jgi:hypothetical protein